jgi:uncharacterized protein
MIFAIADLHLPSSLGKTMDRFGAIWENHPEKIRRNWLETVGPEDSVLICGDISWAMTPEEARCDLDFIASLPGTKYLIRGNHDFWWRRTATNRLQNDLPPDMVLLQGEGRVVEGAAVGGTRGWQAEGPESTPEDERIIQRELAYLEKAFDGLPESSRVAMLHYPPYEPNLDWNDFGRLLLDLGADLVVFGHLHLGNPHAFDGRMENMELQLVAVDQVNFTPQPIRLRRPR